MNIFDLKKLLDNIVGLRLVDINLALNMLMFNFENHAIHVQCLARIVKNNDLLFTTQDYQSWDGKKDINNDERYNLDKYKSIIQGGTVVAVDVNPIGDLTITLDNNIVIQILIQNGYSHYVDEQEQYRFFEIGADDETEEHSQQRLHYVVYNKHIDIE